MSKLTGSPFVSKNLLTGLGKRTWGIRIIAPVLDLGNESFGSVKRLSTKEGMVAPCFFLDESLSLLLRLAASFTLSCVEGLIFVGCFGSDEIFVGLLLIDRIFSTSFSVFIADMLLLY